MAFNLSPDEENTLFEFQKVLKDEIPEEMYNDTILLTKFLRARNFNIKDAKSMIKKNARWRKEMQVDTLLTDFKTPEILQKYMSAQLIGYDKEGYPVRYITIGNVDIKGLLKSANKLTILKSIIRKVEEDLHHQIKQSERLGKPIVHSINIYDTANLSLAMIRHVEGIHNFIQFLKITQDNYPEIIKRAYVINASVYFTTVWPVIQKCMSPELLEKIFVYGEDGWKEELLKTIDADTLPAFLGGNRTDPDGNPQCLTFVNHLSGEPIPQKYYLEKNVSQFSEKQGVKAVKIDRQGKTSEAIEITEPNSIINWEFLIKCYDVGFGILKETKDGRTEELIPVFKVETEYEPFVGMYRCKEEGKYSIVFDNSYSWFHSKEVYFRIWVTMSEEKHKETSSS